ncbi:MAG: hypothetical protein M1822_008753 [Bathelium mastoideum]|nr:MAG: hypothetical protein M1822_008753 [Bathelium mastoideum]
MTTALLVVDMQNFFTSMTETSLPNVLKLISHFRSHAQPIIFTQHGHSKEELTPPYRNQLVRKWGPDGSIAIGSADWELMPEIKKVYKADEVVAKNTYDAFINTPLESKLRDAIGVSRIVVCGVMTDCCCDTTGRAAFNRGFETLLVADACGSANETQHKAGLQAFRFAFGEVVDTKDILQRDF